MKLVNVQKLNDEANKFLVAFNPTPKNRKHFDDFAFLIGKVGASFDLNHNGWVVDEKALEEFEKLESRIFPAQPKPKREVASIIKAENKQITGYETMGADLKLPPYDYQKEVIKFIKDNKNALIVLPCGSGKTPVGIASYLEARKDNPALGIGLFIVKASLKVQWAAEIKKFSDLRPSVIKTYKDATSKISQKISRREKKLEKTKDSRERKLIEKEISLLITEREQLFNAQFENCDVLVLNYETLKDEQTKKKLHEINPQFLFCDEIHYCKSASVDRSKALHEFNTAIYKIGATATPVQRDPRDIFGLFKFIEPSLFPKKSQFESLYIRWAGFGRVLGSKNEKQLNEKISPFMIIKTKEEVAKELPKLIVSQRYCEFEPKQQEMYNKLMEELEELKEKEKALTNQLSERELLENEEYQKVEAGIMARITFAQAMSDSEQLLSGSTSEMAKKYATNAKVDNKLEMLVDLVNEIIESGEKVCIFSKFAKMQQIITERFRKDKTLKDYKIAYVRGSISAEQRYEEVYTKFRDNDEYKVLLCSDAGAEGLNLSKTKYLIEYEPADSYLIQTQRHGRLERSDSIHETVVVYQLIVKDSYDEIGQKIIEKKERYDTTIVKGQELPSYERGR